MRDEIDRTVAIEAVMKERERLEECFVWDHSPGNERDYCAHLVDAVFAVRARLIEGEGQ